MLNPEQKSDVKIPAEDFPPCLIGGKSHHKSHLQRKSAMSYSVDMVRLKGKGNPRIVDDLYRALDTWMGTDSVDTYASNKTGGYRNLWVFDCGESTISVGWGHIEGNRRTNAGIGFMEYNPNKVGKQGAVLIDMLLGRFGITFSAVRYDLAIDYAVERDYVRLVKDRRKYGCEISNGMTEYLGVRNEPGRVKVYDKAAEQNVFKPWTRVELTADANWTVDEVVEKLPYVYSVDSVEYSNLRGLTRAYASSLMKLAKCSGVSVEAEMRSVDPKTRTKLREVMREHHEFEYSNDAISGIAERVSRWGVGGATEYVESI